MIQKAILSFHGKNQEAIISEVILELPKSSSNANGLHVTKKMLSLTIKPEYEKYQTEVTQIMAKNTIEMAQNPYGNYALQIVLDCYPYTKVLGINESITERDIVASY